MKKWLPTKRLIIPTLLTYLVLAVLTSAQIIILDKYVNLETIPSTYTIAMVLYWLIVSGVFTYIVQKQIQNKFELPMQKLAEATKKVAHGDFSIYVKPIHLNGNYDYIDYMIQDFNLMVEELGSIETLKTDFFSNVSHEIKTPLSVIQSYAQALQNENLTPQEKKDYTNTIIKYSKRLSELITNFLKLKKLEKQNIQPIAKPYDVCRQLTECILQFENIWETKNITVQVNTEDRRIIETDASLIELIWNNLLSNAFKFTPPGGEVSLSQTATEEEVIIKISDTGEGMSEENMQHIFEKFYQGDSSRSTEGNGLGLSLVLRVLQIIGGSISVKSALGQGSTFTVRIPIAPQELSGEHYD